jgi:hypothetical protein
MHYYRLRLLLDQRPTPKGGGTDERYGFQQHRTLSDYFYSLSPLGSRTRLNIDRAPNDRIWKHSEEGYSRVDPPAER